jgi:hypothetical protein
VVKQRSCHLISQGELHTRQHHSGGAHPVILAGECCLRGLNRIRLNHFKLPMLKPQSRAPRSKRAYFQPSMSSSVHRPMCPYAHLSVGPLVYMPIGLAAQKPIVNVSIRHMSIGPFADRTICSCAHPSIRHLPIHPSTHPSIRPSSHPLTQPTIRLPLDLTIIRLTDTGPAGSTRAERESATNSRFHLSVHVSCSLTRLVLPLWA